MTTETFTTSRVNRLSKSIAACVFAVGLVGTGNAALVDNGNYTSDNTSGLDWLDITETSPYGHSFVLAQLAPGGMFEGWRVATSEEIAGLLAHAGWNGEAGLSAEHDGLTETVSILTGATVNGSKNDYPVVEVIGRVNDFSNAGEGGEPTVSLSGLSNWEGPDYQGKEEVCPTYCFTLGVSPSSAGTWLVRPTEEPYLTVTPPSGDYLSTQRFDIGVIVRDLAPIESVTVSLNGYDYSGAFQACMVSGAFATVGQTLRCPAVSLTDLQGVGEHLFEVSITFSSGAVLNQSAVWNVIDNIE